MRKNRQKYTKQGSIYHALSFHDPREFVLALNKKLCRFATRIYYVSRCLFCCTFILFFLSELRTPGGEMALKSN